ncbi:MAG: tetratricopeptide repeat protein [Proteobacteria bacterium]|nr:tetratricopeptide repeat protein [Pseudomonadota bacterium]
MSLLNAALRKKDKENKRQNTPPPLFNKSEKIQSKTKYLIYGLIACLVIAIGIAIPYLANMFLPKKPNSPLPRPQDIVIEKQEANVMDADSFQSNNISHMQDSKTNETITNLPEKPTSILPEKTVETPVKKEAEIKSEQIINPKLPSKPVFNKPAAKKASAGFSPNEKPVSRKLIKPFYEKAVQYHMQKRLKEAIMMYRQVLDKDPHNRDALFNLSCAYLEHREPTAALPILNDLYENDPNNPLVIINLAIARIETGEPEIAISLLDTAQNISGMPLFDIYFHKAAAFSSLWQLDEAMSFYKMAEKKDPGNNRLIFNMAVLYDKMENYNEALRYYLIFLKNNGWASNIEKESVEERVQILTVFIEKKQNQIP